MMSTIDQPGIRRILWERMRGDLQSLVPWFRDNELLLCPLCCRALPFDAFSLEHIIPIQALANDPPEIRELIPTNQRAGLTLLCNKRFLINKKTISANGCNGWKGRYFDGKLNQVFKDNLDYRYFTAAHHLGLFAAAYLGLFREYGYSVALTPAGSLARQQFFSPFRWLKQMPIMSQMALGGRALNSYDGGDLRYWSNPFGFSLAERSGGTKGILSVGMRNMSVMLPVSRDPAAPLALALPFAPSRYKLRPQLSSMFD